ncbi:hypothetical protein HQ576_15645 [bacterium]|nr:hypothetical protein [bacterium]
MPQRTFRRTLVLLMALWSAGQAARAAEGELQPLDVETRPDKGRILVFPSGEADLTVDVLDAKGKVVHFFAVPHDFRFAPSGFLEPGTYTLRIRRDAGGKPIIVPDVTVKGGQVERLIIAAAAPRSASAATQPALPAHVKRLPPWSPPKDPTPRVPDFKPKSFAKVNKDLALTQKPNNAGGKKKGRAAQNRKGKKKGSGKKNQKK